ncbi:dTDP-4-dehydrorhamnose 3,5-epimerase and related enzyme [Candidatus Scalindua japonica]|uniref:dTDP-4-dehydrorhamnose 3,5-epimerase n=1 Tax=Candidatus Scalindua japonica TaxID=1284222 RepID=A0A286U4L5_9BACT|nr:dTDP-4-dehydrorhamnose 3,5-epimerase [Candidatus Scalindua japonica]GAX63001.1 dTDP-4-dehydrorhamnose 3,5-epimerase and related enzyme [Candidatus Scalindua japonica]
MSFQFKKLAIPEVILIEPEVFKDDRGFFMETYKLSDFKKTGIDVDFVQICHSRSSKNILRGLHYQLNPNAQGKLVRCIKGDVFDVAVDIREGSPTFGKWVAEILSEDNNKMLYIPEGFAHGFVVLSDWADMLYNMTNEYAPESARGIAWDDAGLAISWPVSNPVLSESDQNSPALEKIDNTFKYEK